MLSSNKTIVAIIFFKLITSLITFYKIKSDITIVTRYVTIEVKYSARRGGIMNFEKYLDEKVKSIVKIEEGFSVDEKYLVNNKFLVRLISEDRIDRFKFAYDTQKRFHAVAKCQKPIGFFIDSPYSFYISEYLPGKNGLEVIGDFTKDKQYDLGVEAGLELIKFHKANPAHDFDTKTYINNYFESKVQTSIDALVKDVLPHIDEIVNLVRNNLHYLYVVPTYLTHSDYHLFNMIFDGEKYMGVIDFERCRNGIFLTDFRNNTPHNSDVSPYFASGFIDGYLSEFYFDDFFICYNVHDLLMSIAAIPWIKEFDPGSLNKSILFIDEMYQSLKDVSKKPNWYVGKY